MKITVLGGGGMATACAILLAEHNDQQVSIWARNPAHAEQIQQARENKRLLPGVPLPANIDVTADIELALRAHLAVTLERSLRTTDVLDRLRAALPRDSAGE